MDILTKTFSNSSLKDRLDSTLGVTAEECIGFLFDDVLGYATGP